MAASRAGRSPAEAILEIHRRFCALLPDDLLWVTNPETENACRWCRAGCARHDVRVGTHIAISPGAVPRFLNEFEEVYSGLGDTETFSRLPRRTTVSSGFTRFSTETVASRDSCRTRRCCARSTRAACGRSHGDSRATCRRTRRSWPHATWPRRNDLDGRGNLSEENLAEFTRFFLTTCIDQVAFMASLMQPDRLRARILVWAEEEIRLETLPPKSGNILEAILYRGELPRADVAAIINTGERQARRVVAALTRSGVLVSASTRAPLRLAFPAALASRWMPGLFPDQVS